MKLDLIKSLAAALLLIPTAVLADYQDDIGYRSLENDHRLISKGANVRVGQVEARIEQAYMPDRGRSEFSGKQFIPSSPANPSGHATMVGLMIYGQDGIAPATPTINIYDSTAFLIGRSGLRVGQHPPPSKFNVSVLNNSWVAGFTSDSDNQEAIRRLDLMINRDDVLVVSSVDNGAGSAYPKLLATAYNSIAVGLLGDPGSSSGPITFDSNGPRAKPDIVVPRSSNLGTTSEAAGAVSGAAALIRSEAKARLISVSELTTKALLLAGAQRPDGWERGAPGAQDDQKVPLDYHYGAGSLRVDNSFDILVAGRHATGGADTGWDTALARKKGRIYQFNVSASVDDDGDDDAFTAVLTWNRQIKRGMHGAFTGSLADLEMSLLKKSAGKWRRVTRSDSDFDNVETITLNDLAPGAYRLIVRGDKPEPYSLAWFTSPDVEHDGGNSGPGSLNSGSGSLESSLFSGEMVATAVPEPALIGLILPTLAMLSMRRRRIA
ncbi:MAG TPA: S8 family serine peptidase [Tepidisphaeraceae bacterium]|jgi:hypothetical protein|nr:S8 family serine peptidase [Tepidisphaeraceae bacterium]